MNNSWKDHCNRKISRQCTFLATKYTEDVSSNIWTLGKYFSIVALLTWFDIIYFWGALEVISEQSNAKVSCLKTVFAFIQNVNISF